MIPSLRYTVLALWVGLCLPAVASANGVTTMHTLESCSTKQGTKSVKKVCTSTQTSTTTLQVPVYTRLTSTHTVTPAPTTTTRTVTHTATSTKTDLLIVDGYVTTVTPTTTLTATVTSTRTNTVVDVVPTTVTVTSTSTQVPAAGYTPLGTQVKALGDTYSKRGVVIKREPIAPSLKARTTKKKAPCKGLYPQSVRCNKLIEKIVVVPHTLPATKTLTRTAAKPTRVAYKTVSTTTTKTVAPADISITATVTVALATHTLTSTSTTTTILETVSIQTMTQLATATAYPACQANNRVSLINGNAISLVVPAHLATSFETDVTLNSASDCCIRCQTFAGCKAYAFELTGSLCALFTGPATTYNYQLQTLIRSTVTVFTVGNGESGHLTGVIPVL